MPNYCDFNMRVRGKKENVSKFYDWMRAEYHYGSEDGIEVFIMEDGIKTPTKHHIGYRVFDCYTNADEFVDDEIVSFYGDCAWSVYSCMFEGIIGTYMGDSSYGRPTDKVISLLDACKELNIECELFSSEPGCCFSEHYYIKDGELIVNEDTKYIDLYLPEYDKNCDEYDEEAYNELSDDLKEIINQYLDSDYDTFIPICSYYNLEEEEWEWEYLY